MATFTQTFATGEGYRESKLWGGSLTENIVQAVARDIFAEGLLRLARAGLDYGRARTESS